MIDLSKQPFYWNGITFPEIGGRPSLITREEMFGADVQSIVVQSLGPQDDDLRVRINGIVVSDTRWNVGWYKADSFLTKSVPPFPPLNNADHWRKITVDNFSALPRPPRSGDLIEVDLFDGWAGAWAMSPVQIGVTFTDGTQQIATVGTATSGTSTGSNPATNTFSSGPHFSSYYPIGALSILPPARCCTF